MAELLEGMRAMQRDVAEARDAMTKMQEVQNQHSDAIMAIESGGSGARMKEEEDDEKDEERDESARRVGNGGKEDDTVDESLLPLTKLLHRVLDRAGDVSDKQSYVLAACTRALSKFELTAKLKDQAKWVEIVKVSMETNDCGSFVSGDIRLWEEHLRAALDDQDLAQYVKVACRVMPNLFVTVTKGKLATDIKEAGRAFPNDPFLQFTQVRNVKQLSTSLLMRRRVKREVKKLIWEKYGVARWAEFREDHEEAWSQLDGTEDRDGNKMEIKPWEKMEVLMDKLEESQAGETESEQTWAHCFDAALEGHDLAGKRFGYDEMCALIKARCEGAAMREKEGGRSQFGAVAAQNGRKENDGRCDWCCEEGHYKRDCPLFKSGGKAVCRKWVKSGECPRGGSCRYDHPAKYGKYAQAEQNRKPPQPQLEQQPQKGQQQRIGKDPAAARRFLLSLSEEQASALVGMHSTQAGAYGGSKLIHGECTEPGIYDEDDEDGVYMGEA